MKKRKLSTIIARAMVGTALVSILMSFVASVGILVKNGYDDTIRLIGDNIEDIEKDITEKINVQILDNAMELEQILWNNMYDLKRYSPAEATRYLNSFSKGDAYTDINVVDVDGLIIYSANPEKVGYDLHSLPQDEEFLALLEDEKTFIQEPRRDAGNDGRILQFAGAAFPDKSGFVQIGIDMDVFENMAVEQMLVSIRNRRIGNDGLFLVCNSQLQVVGGTSDRYSGWDLTEYQEDFEKMKMDEDAYILFFDEDFDIFCIKETHGYNIVGIYPLWSALSSFKTTSVAVLVIEMILFFVVFLVVYVILKKRVVYEVQDINDSLKKIAAGELSEEVDVRGSAEFDSLSDNINLTLDKLREAAKDERVRHEEQKTLLNEILQNALPHIFPAFPQRKEFGIYAALYPRDGISRDFYDFYFISDNRLVLLIVDIFGKGAGTTVFMTALKSILKTLMGAGMSVEDAFTEANRRLTSEYDLTDQYITATAWIGEIDLKSGELTFVNSGHTAPILIHDKKADFIVQKSDLVLCAKTDQTYTRQELLLEPGDFLLLYTDGITEAQNPKGIYYDKRFLKLLNKLPESKGFVPEKPNETCSLICNKVYEDVMSYTGYSTPVNDITMLCFGLAPEAEEELS